MENSTVTRFAIFPVAEQGSVSEEMSMLVFTDLKKTYMVKMSEEAEQIEKVKRMDAITEQLEAECAKLDAEYAARALAREVFGCLSGPPTVRPTPKK